jgi:hypothetical protein
MCTSQGPRRRGDTTTVLTVEQRFLCESPREPPFQPGRTQPRRTMTLQWVTARSAWPILGRAGFIPLPSSACPVFYGR